MTNLTVLTLFAAISCAWAYSGGAPVSTCDDMTPKHGKDAQSSELPYKILLSRNAVKPGEVIDITISDKTFIGYLLQVRDGDKAVGQFIIPDDDKYSKTINCHSSKKNAATHKNATDKKNFTVQWKAPRKTGKYTVYATVVQHAKTFWAREPTQEITVN